MIYNYPYFGFPNYNNYMNKNFKEPPPPNFNINPYSKISNDNSNCKNTQNNFRSNYMKSNYKQSNYCNNNYNGHNYAPHNYIQSGKPYAQKNNAKKDNIKNNNIKNDNQDSNVFNILGISLHFDDILLICLILFLNNEKISDNYLMLSLILLLLG